MSKTKAVEAPAPVSHGEIRPATNHIKPSFEDRRSIVKGILDEAAGDTGKSEEPGESAPAPADGGNDSGTSEVDLGEPDAPESLPDDPEEPAAAVADEPITVAKLAESLGVDPADVYELEVPIDKGVTVSLGELKDAFKQYGPVKEAIARNKEDRSDFERQVLKTRTELSAIVAAIPPELRERVVQEARSRNSTWEKEQERLALETMPELGKADERAKFREMLIEDGAEYGFSEQEITYTQDARTLRMLRDFATMKRELQAMKSAAKRQPGRANPPGKAAASNPSKQRLRDAIVQRGRADPTSSGKAAAIAALLRS